MSDDRVEPHIARVAAALRAVAKDLRAAGDMGLVRLSEDGVTPEAITLADELWLYALLLDGEMDAQ